MNIGRNSKCHCGSGKKYKKCCLLEDSLEKSNNTKIEDLIKEAGLLSLEHNREKKELALKNLSDISNSYNLSKNQKLNLNLNLATTYQHMGEHFKAIEILESLEEYYDGKEKLSLHMLHMLAVSYSALSHYDQACEMFDIIHENWDSDSKLSREDRKTRGVLLIEAGKSYSYNEQTNKAKECWEKSVSLLEDFSGMELEHLNRAKANLLLISLKSENLQEQEEAVEKLEDSIVQKLKIGDIQGASTNYCNLGTYFKEKKRYARALAYYRKDLSISRYVGNKRELAATLGNIAMLYAELKQYTKGRKLLREAKEIGEKINDEYLLYLTKHQLDTLNKFAKTSGLNKEKIGEKAECACESNKLYVNCCGRADFEPVSLPSLYGGISEDIQDINNRIKEKGKLTSPLDFILRQSEEAERRKSWLEMGGHDGIRANLRL